MFVIISIRYTIDGLLLGNWQTEHIYDNRYKTKGIDDS